MSATTYENFNDNELVIEIRKWCRVGISSYIIFHQRLKDIHAHHVYVKITFKN